ncbi:hypothetical protein TEA_013853 [Camellia sinensis var. sinensis]|uniref:CS domain-containing protein n=1 Tax=Camellia sinensis var. sinensis TaxID=542762 RepID=A0A4S4EFN9_CAMSN|nr:hypothetical protein TEA_013853 [Camellia sinensis var. sinensis]
MIKLSHDHASSSSAPATAVVTLLWSPCFTPNKGKGLDLNNYSWVQSVQEVTINIPVPPGTKSRFIACEIKKNHLKIGLKGHPPIIDGKLFQSVKVEDCIWSLVHEIVGVKGDPELDTQKAGHAASEIVGALPLLSFSGQVETRTSSHCYRKSITNHSLIERLLASTFWLMVCLAQRNGLEIRIGSVRSGTRSLALARPNTISRAAVTRPTCSTQISLSIAL